MRRYIISLLLSLALASTLQAQTLTGTLKRVADSGVFTIGYVPDAPPMSFDDPNGKPTGFSIALCLHVANAVKEAAGVENLEIRYVQLISPEDRLNAVQNHTVDIECGATTVTLSRRELVDFSLMTFITGAAVLSLTSKPIMSVEDLSGKTVAVIRDTTTDAGLRTFITKNEFKITLRMIATHTEGMELLAAGKVDGYASDRAMLIGQVFQSPDRSKFTITRDVFSFEPYALMLPRGDTNFRLATDRALANLYRGARIRRLYQDWFGRYGEPMSPILEALYEFQAVAE
ncbi:MAG: amino acid ABC transporter substrate-binding protein [Gammaproteobacteria bacterium]|nr:amino acid ABC transporter substrate-binding protein [Gammaproteobacteria bacterium]MDH5215034.1 amino acid ABC transporter substrate-binding protein [Gammaproteobacteria bacterium]MDH5501841.1 amino acid ABC transporter substrate-binding protein [Gammaproteobacteria bacterium]